MKAAAMMPLHRHQIAWLGDGGWRNVLDRDWDAQARSCLAHWAAKRLPLVVTRQANRAAEGAIALGLAAPNRWGRRRLALCVPRSDVLYFDEFAQAERLLGLLPVAMRPAWTSVCGKLKAAGLVARVYGSYGWQLLSGLQHVGPGSDIDLWLSVSDLDQADRAVACLESFDSAQLRLDGELVFGDGGAVAWREWSAWRNGRVKALLVKSIDGSALEHSPAWRSAMSIEEVA